jgi:hypothetical protein
MGVWREWHLLKLQERAMPATESKEQENANERQCTQIRKKLCVGH